MHQQIRTKFGTTSTTGGPGAMDADADPAGVTGGHIKADERTLVGLLELLERRRVNICLVGGDAISGDGEFVFAIDHEEGDDATQALRDELAKEGYRVAQEVVEPRHEWLPANEPGALLKAIGAATGDGVRADEVLIGQTRDGQAFAHIRTVG